MGPDMGKSGPWSYREYELLYGSGTVWVQIKGNLGPVCAGSMSYCLGPVRSVGPDMGKSGPCSYREYGLLYESGTVWAQIWENVGLGRYGSICYCIHPVRNALVLAWRPGRA